MAVRRHFNLIHVSQRRIRKDAEQRLAERDAREAADRRTPQQVFLGEPETSRHPPEPPASKREYSQEDIAAASIFAAVVSEQLERLAKVRRTRVRLSDPPRRERVRLGLRRG